MAQAFRRDDLMTVDRARFARNERALAVPVTVGLRRSWMAAAGFGLAGGLLIGTGTVDLIRAGRHVMDWQLDEWLLIAFATGLGMVVARNLGRRTGRREGAWAAAEPSHGHACCGPQTELFDRNALADIARHPPVAGQVRLLMVADIDDFRGVNDTHGRATVDSALCRFGVRLREVVSGLADARAARLGGGEFLLVLNDASAWAGVHARLLRPMKAIGADGCPVEVSYTAGLTAWPAGLPIESAIEQAEYALHEARRTAVPLCRFDQMSGDTDASPQRLKRMFERELSVIPDRSAQIWVAAISPDRYYAAKRTMGHGYAARLLRALAEALREDGPGLLIEHVASDTLAVLFAAEDIAQATEVVGRLTARGSHLRAADGSSSVQTLTVGLAGPAPASSVRQTVEQAQLALDEAQRSGRKQVVFDLLEQERTTYNIDLMRELRNAIAADQLELHYQPKVDARSGEIDSMEALVRWRHPEHGAIPPGVFVPIAEASGDVEALTDWVIQRAARDWETLQAVGLARMIYVNVSAQLIGAAGFADRLLAALNGLPDRIGIEITETAVLDNPTNALRHLGQIAAAGISIAIDDYGVGLSSLSYLKKLPATELKIDMSFITHLADSHRDPMIVRSTIDLAHGLGLRVTAEGVDKAEVFALLKIMGCDMIQGYQIAAAMPMDQMVSFMRAHDSSAEYIPECAALFLEQVNG